MTGSPQGPVKPRWEKDLSLEEVFVKLGIDEHAHIFISQGEYKTVQTYVRVCGGGGP